MRVCARLNPVWCQWCHYIKCYFWSFTPSWPWDRNKFAFTSRLRTWGSAALGAAAEFMRDRKVSRNSHIKRLAEAVNSETVPRLVCGCLLFRKHRSLETRWSAITVKSKTKAQKIHELSMLQIEIKILSGPVLLEATQRAVFWDRPTFVFFARVTKQKLHCFNFTSFGNLTPASYWPRWPLSPHLTLPEKSSMMKIYFSQQMSFLGRC